MEQWKEACCEVTAVKGFDAVTAKSSEQILYEFPDGYSQMFGEERFRFGEMLYDPKNYFNQVSRSWIAANMFSLLVLRAA